MIGFALALGFQTMGLELGWVTGCLIVSNISLYRLLSTCIGLGKMHCGWIVKWNWANKRCSKFIDIFSHGLKNVCLWFISCYKTHLNWLVYIMSQHPCSSKQNVWLVHLLSCIRPYLYKSFSFIWNSRYFFAKDLNRTSCSSHEKHHSGIPK